MKKTKENFYSVDENSMSNKNWYYKIKKDTKTEIKTVTIFNSAGIVALEISFIDNRQINDATIHAQFLSAADKLICYAKKLINAKSKIN